MTEEQHAVQEGTVICQTPLMDKFDNMINPEFVKRYVTADISETGGSSLLYYWENFCLMDIIFFVADKENAIKITQSFLNENNIDDANFCFEVKPIGDLRYCFPNSIEYIPNIKSTASGYMNLREEVIDNARKRLNMCGYHINPNLQHTTCNNMKFIDGLRDEVLLISDNTPSKYEMVKWLNREPIFINTWCMREFIELVKSNKMDKK